MYEQLQQTVPCCSLSGWAKYFHSSTGWTADLFPLLVIIYVACLVHDEFPSPSCSASASSKTTANATGHSTCGASRTSITTGQCRQRSFIDHATILDDGSVRRNLYSFNRFSWSYYYGYSHHELQDLPFGSQSPYSLWSTRKSCSALGNLSPQHHISVLSLFPLP